MRDLELQFMWRWALGMVALPTLALLISGFQLIPGPWGILYLMLAAACMIVNSRRTENEPEWLRRAMLFCNGFLLCSLVFSFAAYSTYWIASVSPAPLADPILYRADLLLGFDWRKAFAAYHSYPQIHFYAQFCYASIAYSPMIVLIGLSTLGLEQRMRQFLLAIAITLMVCLAFFFIMPAEAALTYLVGTNPEYMPRTGIVAWQTLLDLRAGVMSPIELDKMTGLITFPSFHTASAVLYLWAGWGIRFLRWPIAIVNVGMILATPMEGTHYLVDVIGGVLLAMAAIYAAKSMPRLTSIRSFRSPSLAMQP